MIELFLNFKKKRVRETTYYNYGNKIPYLKPLFKVKLKDFNYSHFERWHDYMDYETTLATRTKNDLMKYLKSTLNYGMKWYDFNFNSMYKKMVNFSNPNEMPKEMQFYTYEEFKLFISVENDLKFKTLFETLYYCGLRRGELRGLIWNNIDFERKTLSVSKQITDRCGTVKKFKFVVPKTQNSIRTLKMPEILVNSLKRAKLEAKQLNGFNENYFVAGDAFPISSNALADRKNANCEKAGVKQIRIHDFRHSCASLLINNGANITLVAKYLGHSKIDETLNTYSHMFRSVLDNVVDTINKLDNK